MYNTVVTICNKLKKTDAGTDATKDKWFKTVLSCAEVKISTMKSVSDSTASMAQAVTVLIPFGQGYKPYQSWKNSASYGFTMSVGDYIFIDMVLSETPTPDNIASLKQLYKGNVCEVRSIQTAKSNGMAKVELMIEGV